MDDAIETGFWERAKTFLNDHNNVRVVCMYKYGKDQQDNPLPASMHNLVISFGLN